jgi:2-polyprenyl-6-methoxyphenol hydroxylase-like FAD-dependent oxidoreductase
VVIVGAGFAGLALACALVRAGQSARILERRAELPTHGAALGLQPNGLAALARIGVLEQALAAGSRIDRLLMYDRHGRRVACVDYGELEHPQPFMLLIRRSDLLGVLADELAGLGGAPVSHGAEVYGLVRRGESVHGVRFRRGGDESELRAWCVAGADGVRSVVRRELRIPVRTWGEDRRYVVGIGARPDGLEDAMAHVHHGAGYSDGVMPLGERAYFYDSVTEANREAVADADLAAWRAVYADRVPYATELLAPVEHWGQLSVLHSRPSLAARRTEHGAALVGDAAAAVHPHSAQGANLALEDGVALGERLIELDRGRELRRSDLASYNRSRGRKAARYVPWSRLAGRSFDGETAVWRMVRWSGWQWMRLPPARKAMLRIGAGLR